MKSITINKEIHTLLKNVAVNGESVNKTVTRLLESDEIQDYVENPRAVIKVSEENYKKLDALKGSPKESYGSVILRLINSQ